MATFDCITYNCNGIGDNSKRSKIFTYLKEKISRGVCFLQETHSVPTEETNTNIFFFHMVLAIQLALP